MSRRHSAFRRFALALIYARVLAFALAPLLELQIARDSAPSIAAVTSDHESANAPVHDPASCPACVILQAHSTPDYRVAELVVSLSSDDRAPEPRSRLPHSVPRSGVQSRAPPRASI